MRRHLFLLVVASCGFHPVSENGTLVCGTGTVEQDGKCVSTLVCGSGTTEQNGKCVSTLICGAGTIAQGGACVATGVECGTGTHLEGDKCVASVTICGAGTTEQMGACVADVACGPGTKLQNGLCVPSSGGGLICGTGTQEVNGACVSMVTCGSGTTLTNGQCTVAPGAWWDVRIATNQVPADGFTRVQVLAFGRHADGTPAVDPIVFSLSRSSAGSLNPTTATLSNLGTNTMFTPCSTTSSTCLGPASISIALASNPSVTVATANFDLVTPPGVGSPANCLAYPRALYFDGTGYIFTGMQLVTQGTFNNQPGSGGVIRLDITPTQQSQGSWWDVEMAPPQGQMLAAQIYNGATRWPFQAPTNPGLDVTGDGRGCNQSSGRFQIETLSMDGGTLTELVATFEQFCENQPTNVLRGCIRYTP